MINLFDFLYKDVSSLKSLKKTIKNADNGIFYVFYYAISESDVELKKRGYRDIYYYKRLVKGKQENTIKFYTRLMYDEKNHPYIIVCKIEIY